MGFKIKNWVQESTATTGTGTMNMGGATAGHISFENHSEIASGDTTEYILREGTDKERGIGTVTSGTPWTLSRDRVIESLISGTRGTSKINLGGNGIIGINASTHLPGTIVQLLRKESTTRTSDANGVPHDNTKPQQSTEGTKILEQAITPLYEDSMILVEAHIQARGGNNVGSVIALHKDSTEDALKVSYIHSGSDVTMIPLVLSYDELATNLTARTFKINFGQNVGTMWVNGESGGSFYNGTLHSVLTVSEIRALG